MILSVIVPVYNVEKYLRRCLDSLLRQGMAGAASAEALARGEGEWEVICVDDCSADGSSAILQEYAGRWPGIFRVVRHEENQGLGGARNSGVALARGEWVAFVDSDDYLVDGGYRYLCDHFLAGKPDVLQFHHHNVYTDGTSLADPEARPDGRVEWEGDGADIYNEHPLLYVWSKFFRLQFLLDKEVWSEIVVCEDELFNFSVFRNHPRTLVVTSSIYRYENGNRNSIMKTSDREAVLVHLNDLYYNMGLMERYLRKGHTEMAPAAHRLLSKFRGIYQNKMLNAPLTRDDWERYTRVLNLRRLMPERLTYDRTLQARAVAWLKRRTEHSYWEYRLVRFFYIQVFKRFLFRRIVLS